MKPIGLIVLLFFGHVVFAFAQKPHDEVSFSSPDQKWEVCGKWMNDHYGWFLKNTQTKKVYFEENALPISDPMGAKSISALWSPDGHFVAINRSMGTEHGAKECSVYSVALWEPKEIKTPWVDPSAFGRELLKNQNKNKDVRRFNGVYNYNWFSAEKWMTNTDLELSCFLKLHLEPDDKSPQQWVHIDAMVHFHFDENKPSKIIYVKFRSYLMFLD